MEHSQQKKGILELYAISSDSFGRMEAHRIINGTNILFGLFFQRLEIK